MKFTDGHWLTRAGYVINSSTEVRDLETDGGSIKAYSSCRPIVHRGNTLNTPVLTISFSSPMPDVICVRAEHHRGRRKTMPEFEINAGETAVNIVDGDASVSLESGSLRVEISKAGAWRTEFSYGGKKLTSSESKNMAWIEGPDKRTYMREQLELDVGECVYGLGEHFTSLVKNGQSVDIWNRDGGTSSEQAYKNIPFYITNRGYGVFVNDPGMVSFEVASERVSKVQFSAEGERLEYFIIGGKDLKEVLANYTALTGRPVLPPPWSFGLWLTTSFTTEYDEGTVTGFIDGMINRGIPLSVFHFDCFWMKEFQWCDFEWDRSLFPDPPGMLKRIKAKGLRICVWINPYIAQKSKLFDEGMEKGFLLHGTDGNVWQWDQWQAGMGLVDFTNPDACAWYQEKLKTLLDMGVDCFKTDFGERIPVDVRYWDGSDPQRMHNYYTYLYNKTVYDLLLRERGAGEGVLFARSATAGGQQFPVHWGGDCTASFASMAESLRGGLSLCLSGFGFWSHDISGFEATATPDLYKRWAAFGLLSSHSRLHGSESYRVPWLFDEEAVDVVRYFTRLKCSLMPCLFSAAVEAARTGVPMMRAMALEFYGDPACDTLDRQYMLGGNLLVAPVFRESGDVDYYLPDGLWTNLITGERREGGKWVHERHGYMSLPLMVRPNSVIAVGSVDDRPDYDYADGVTFHVFELSDGISASATIHDASGSDAMSVTVARSANRLIVTAACSTKPWRIVLRNIQDIVGATGATVEKGENAIVLRPDGASRRMEIRLA